MIILLHSTSKKLGGWKSVFVKQPNNQSRIKIKHAIHSRNLQAKRSRKCLPSPQETLTDTHTHTLGHMMTSSQHEYSRAVHSYSATVRLSTARALLRSAARSSPTRIPHPSPTLPACAPLMGAFRASHVQYRVAVLYLRSSKQSTIDSFPILTNLKFEHVIRTVQQSNMHTVINARTNSSHLSSRQVGGAPGTHSRGFHSQTRPDSQVAFLNIFKWDIPLWWRYTNVKTAAVNHN